MPLTDRQREATLDLLEAQVRNSSNLLSIANSASIFKTVAFEVRHIHSVPQREANGLARIAAPTVKWQVKVASNSWPQLPTSSAPTGLCQPPQPLGVALALNASSSGGELCASLAALIAQPAAPLALTSVARLGPVLLGVRHRKIICAPALF